VDHRDRDVPVLNPHAAPTHSQWNTSFD
jgi:hypothetical protein